MNGSIIAVQLEQAQRKVWACALDWPGWTRDGKDSSGALAALAAAAPRYARVAAAAGCPLPAGAVETIAVIRTVAGTGSSAFAPMVAAAEEHGPSSAAEARRRAALLAAAWAELDRIAAASTAELQKGPRGGGRDRDAVLQHVLAAEAAYVRKLGLSLKEPVVGDRPAIAKFRAAVLKVLEQPSAGAPAVEKGWPLRYAVRRMAWHVLDHAWEIEDKSGPDVHLRPRA